MECEKEIIGRIVKWVEPYHDYTKIGKLEIGQYDIITEKIPGFIILELFGCANSINFYESFVLMPKDFIIPKLKEFPSSGCCKTLSLDFIKFLRDKFGTSDSGGNYNSATGIGWNNSSYWFLVDVNNSSKPKFDISQLEHFYQESESYHDIVERIKQEAINEQKEKQLIYKKVNHEYTKERGEKINSTKICRFNFKIRQTDPIRGISLRSTKSKIRLGSNNC